MAFCDFFSPFILLMVVAMVPARRLCKRNCLHSTLLIEAALTWAGRFSEKPTE